MRMTFKMLTVLAVLAASPVVWSEEEIVAYDEPGIADYNCKSGAVKLVVSDEVQQFKLVREWDDSLVYQWDFEQQTTVVYRADCWLDHYPNATTATMASNRLASCWLYVTLERGKDYVISSRLDDIGSLSFFSRGDPSRVVFTQYPFDVDGKRYFVIRAADWTNKQERREKIEYYVKIYGGRNTVGEWTSLSFQQKPIGEIIKPEDQGSVAKPIDLTVTSSGSTEVAPPVEMQQGRLSTAYQVKLVADEHYVFTLTYPSEKYWAVFALPDGVTKADIPEVDIVRNTWGDELTLFAHEDYTLKFVIVPSSSSAGLSVVGAGLSWTVGDTPGPDPDLPVCAGSFAGVLEAYDLYEEDEVKSVSVTALAKKMKDGRICCSATLVLDGVSLEFTDNGDGAIVCGEEPEQSLIDVQLNEVGNLTFCGSIYYQGGELLVDAPLFGAMVDWDQSFLRVDATTMSAIDMGITGGGFKDELAGSDVLVRLREWGCVNNVWISKVNEASFTTSGDPMNSLSEAFLLNCAPDAVAIERQKREFTITAFDPVNGVTVAGDKKDGDAYGNGRIEVRSSADVGGPYDTKAKSGPRLFYRAYLVK